MAENTKIQWATHTFNPWRGCTKVAPGCKFCYAEVNYSVKMHGVEWGDEGNRIRLSDAGWKAPLKWNRQAEGAAERPRVFCASLGDVFEDWEGPILNHEREPLWLDPENQNIMPLSDFRSGFEQARIKPLTMGDLRRHLFKLIDATPNLDWMLLTKRPENIAWMTQMARTRDAETIADVVEASEQIPNLWLYTSVSEQATVDRNVPELLKCREIAPVLGVSAEPLLGPITLDTLARGGPPRWLTGEVDHNDPRLDHVIVGGESGPHARPCQVEWIESLIDQCRAAGVPVFVKQLGADHRWPSIADSTVAELAIKDPKGGEIDEWPARFRVREFPAAVSKTT